jgi:Domain of unknown function (DUF5753)
MPAESVLASADFRVLLDESVLHRRIGAPEVMAMQLEHLLTTLSARDPAALEQAFVVLTAIIGLLTAGYAASLRRGVRRPECDMYVRLPTEDRNSVSRKITCRSVRRIRNFF